ncbi:unnamed protein product [Haemonchus placei]|uniref:G protein-coupled receptor n=1 Tax=Haemonchus placei TaxID=6290 RepID=A0A0N4X6C7_HAEPC|nr:unnamed protein product [Haemonchus placei]
MSNNHHSFEIHLMEPQPLGPIHPGIWILYIIEFLAMVFAVVYIPFIIRILNKTPLLHGNHYMCYCLIVYLESAFNFIIIASATFTHSWCTCAMSLYLPSVVIERCFASKFIIDYEKNSRTWISGIIISLGYTVSAIIAARRYNFVVMVVGFCVLVTICCLLYIALYRRDSARLRDINRGVIPENVVYTLSTRFQLTENLRVLKVNVLFDIKTTITVLNTSLYFIKTCGPERQSKLNSIV